MKIWQKGRVLVKEIYQNDCGIPEKTV